MPTLPLSRRTPLSYATLFGVTTHILPAITPELAVTLAIEMDTTQPSSHFAFTRLPVIWIVIYYNIGHEYRIQSVVTLQP